MNRKKIALVLTVCVVVAMSLASCGKPYGDVKLEDHIKVGKYKGLKVEAYEVKVTDEDVDREIEARLTAAATVQEVKTGEVKEGDTVVITYDGKIDGKGFEGGSAQGSSLTIGSGQFIEGFESGLVGVKVGETKTLKLKFPKDYTKEDVAGKDVEFTVTVDAKQEKVVPKLDEEFVKNNSEQKTIAEYKKAVKEELTKMKEEEAIDMQKDYLWTKILADSEVLKDKDGKEKYPQEKLDTVKEKTVEDYKSFAEQYGMEFEDFLEQQMGMDEETFNEQVEEYAKIVVKQEMVLYYIAEKEGIEVDNKEYEDFIARSLERYGYTEETYKELNGQSYEETVGKDNIMRDAYMEKVLNMILDNAKVVDKLTTEKE